MSGRELSPLAVRVSEAAKLCPFSERTLWDYVARGVLPHGKRGRVVYIMLTDLERFLRDGLVNAEGER